MRSAAHLKGLTLTTLGVLILTPDGLLVRLAQADTLVQAVPRGVLQALGMALIVLLMHGGQLARPFRAIGGLGLWLALLYGIGNLLFIVALGHTSVANVLIFLATEPLFAALLSLWLLGERVPLRTWLAIAAGLVGIGIVVADGLDKPSVLGDAAALLSAVFFSLSFVLMRKRRDLDMIPAVSLSGIVAALLALPLIFLLGPGTEGFTAIATEGWLWLLLDGFIVLPVSFALIVMGPRYIPAAEIGLLFLLETVLGPLWVWWALGERPSDATFIGGAVVIATLALHALASARTEQ